MNMKKIMFYLLAGILGGCLPVMSLHQLYNEPDTIYDQKLIGSWVDEANGVTMDFSRPEGEGKAYRLLYTSIDKDTKKTAKGIFVVRLVKLENKLFLDFFPEELPNGSLEDPNSYKWYYNAFFLIPGHTFAVVDSIEPQLKMRITNIDKMKEFLEKEPNAVKHEMVSGNLVLTAKTAELQKFVIKYVNNKDVFSTEMILKRQK